MGNLQDLLGVTFNASDYPEEKQILSFDLINNLKENALKYNINLPEFIQTDGVIHRFTTNGKRDDDAGWYVFHDHIDFIAGTVGDHRTGEVHNIFSSSKEITQEERNRINKQIESDKAKREIEHKKKLEKGIKDCTKEWKIFKNAPTDHPYLINKGVEGDYNLKIDSYNNLIIPRFNKKGELQSYQRISAISDNGKWKKTNKKDAIASETFFIIGNPEISRKIYIAEGIATAISIYKASECACFVSFSCHNMPFTAKIAKDSFKNKKIIIAADNGKAGERWGKIAADKIGANIMIAPGEDGDDFNDFQNSGGDLKSLLNDKSFEEKFKLISSSDIPEKFEPLDELVQELLVKGRISIIYGDSNSGKTFFSLAMARDISEGWDFCGRKTEKGRVLYIAVEAPGSILMRIQAMNKYYGHKLKNIDIITRPINFYESKNVEYDLINYIKDKGDYNFVIVDTLAQSTAGANENSAEDMGPIMQRFEQIANETNTAVLIIHHSGKDKTKGARGSSSIYAHIYTEIMVVDDKGEKTATITKQRELGSKGDEIPYKLEIVHMGKGKFGDNKSTCVAVFDDEKREVKKGKDANSTERKRNESIRIIFEAWKHSGKNMHKEKPFIPRESVKKILEKDGMISNRTIENYLRPSATSGLIKQLIDFEDIENATARIGEKGKITHGWVLKNNDWISTVTISENFKNAQK